MSVSKSFCKNGETTRNSFLDQRSRTRSAHLQIQFTVRIHVLLPGSLEKIPLIHEKLSAGGLSQATMTTITSSCQTAASLQVFISPCPGAPVIGLQQVALLSFCDGGGGGGEPARWK